jgi:hypothetical protein
MSLKSDVKFVVSLIGGAIRQSLGDIFRQLADYFQSLPEDPPVPPKEEPLPVRPRTPARARRQAISRKPPPEVLGSIQDVVTKQAKVRDRSGYNPKDHNQFKVAALGILRVLLSEPNRRSSAPALAKELKGTKTESTETTIRTACKTLVEDGIFDRVLDNQVNSVVYWVRDSAAARKLLDELEANPPYLPTEDGPST